MSLTPQMLAPSAGPVWLRVGTLLDGTDSAPARSGHLVYDAQRILYTGASLPAANLLRLGQIEPDADLPLHTVLPGLIDAHAHLFLEGGEENPAKRADYLKLPSAELLVRAEARLERLLAIGVTAVRDAGDRHGVGLGLQARFRDPARGRMPHVDSPGAAIHHQGRYGGFMARPLEEFATPAACVDARLADGAQRIKLIATGIINFELGAVTTPPQMSAEELSQFTTAARTRGKQTFAHCSGREGIDNCIAARVDTIEHGFFVSNEQLARMRDANIGWVPTFAPVQFQLDKAEQLGWSAAARENLKRILDDHAASLAQAAALGVQIIAGSDAGSHGVPHGWGLLDELVAMERAGLTPRQVIHAATGASGKRLDFSEDIGTLRVGAKPRFILMETSPLETMANLGRPKPVVFDGAVFSQGDDRAQPGL